MPAQFKNTFLILTIACCVFLYGLCGLALAAAETKEPPPPVKYSILLYDDNTIFKMNPDGSSREKIVGKTDVLEMFPLSSGRILVHSKQYEGESLEIFDTSNNAWGLVEFTEGKIPSVSVSGDGVTIAYEIKHFPTSIDGDGIWIYNANGAKSHVKISNAALTIESMAAVSGKLHILFHELNLVSDDAGLFMETISLDKYSKPFRRRIPEGMKMILQDGFTLSFSYPSAGKKLDLVPLSGGKTSSVDLPKGDIILFKGGLNNGKEPYLIFGQQSVDFSGAEFKKTLVWKIRTGKIEELILPNLADCDNFFCSPDGWLYFTGCYSDPSGELTSPMLFRTNDLGKKIELVSIHGGIFTFQIQ